MSLTNHTTSYADVRTKVTQTAVFVNLSARSRISIIALTCRHLHPSLARKQPIRLQHVTVEQIVYEGHIDLGENLWEKLGRPVGMPHLEERDLKLLDEAISILNPPEAHVRVVEVDTFTVRGRAIWLKRQGRSCIRSTTRTGGTVVIFG